MSDPMNQSEWIKKCQTMAALTHEINGCLQVALGSAELLDADLPDEHPDKQYATAIVSNCNGAIELMRELQKSLDVQDSKIKC